LSARLHQDDAIVSHAAGPGIDPGAACTLLARLILYDAIASHSFTSLACSCACLRVGVALSVFIVNNWTIDLFEAKVPYFLAKNMGKKKGDVSTPHCRYEAAVTDARWQRCRPLVPCQPSQVGVPISPLIPSLDPMGGGREGRANWVLGFALATIAFVSSLSFFTPISINDVGSHHRFLILPGSGIILGVSPQPPRESIWATGKDTY